MVKFLKHNQSPAASRPTFSALETEHGFRVSIVFQNPDTGKLMSKQFRLRFSAQQRAKLKLTETLIVGILKKVMHRTTLQEIKTEHSKKGISSLVHNFIKRLSRRKVFESERNRLESDGSAPNDQSTEHQPKKSRNSERKECSPAPAAQLDSSTSDGMLGLKGAVECDLDRIAIPFPKKSAFAPEETGVTYAAIGKSFSGKTTFLVKQLNLLTKKELNEYNAIVFFTESPFAPPLKDVKPEVRKRMIVMDRFCPTILRMLKRVNDGTSNKFKFLTIFDDVLDLRGSLMTKSILTLRNSNISTILSVQYEKVITPAQRSSIHNIYLFNLRTESWEYMLKGYLMGNFKETLPSLSRGGKENRMRPFQVAQLLRETLNDYIVYYNQRKDEMIVYEKGY